MTTLFRLGTSPNLTINHLHRGLTPRTDGLRYPIHSYSGRSTVIALETLSRAIKHPGQWYILMDHLIAVKADDALMELVKQYADRMRLRHIEFRKSEGNWFVRSCHME